MSVPSLTKFSILLAITLGLNAHAASATAPTAAKHRKTSGAKTSATPKSSAGAKSGAANSAAAGKSAASAKSGGKKSGRHSSKSGGDRQRGQKTPTPERITEIQQALAKNGALSAAPTGKWDESTTDAMKKFQAAHGLNPSGKVDARSLNELGLGSATAGVAAPAPPIRASAATLPSDIQQ